MLNARAEKWPAMKQLFDVKLYHHRSDTECISHELFKVSSSLVHARPADARDSSEE